MSALQMQNDIADLNAAMDEIIKLLEQETALVRAGKLGDAAVLEADKASLSQRYYACVNRLKAAMPQLKLELNQPRY